MTYWQIFVAPTKGWLTLILLSVLTLVSLIFSIVFVNLGPAVIFIPIILACMYYAKRGFVFSVFVAFIYFILTVALSSDPNVLQTAAIRVPFFILVAGVITYISLQRTRGEEALFKNTEELNAANEQLAAAGEELKSQFDALVESERGTRLSEERLIMAQKIGGTGCWEYSFETDTIWGSAEGLRIFGFPPVARDFPINDIEICIPERERVHQALVDLISVGKEYNLEYAINPADGSTSKVIHSVARLEKDAQGNPTRVMGVIQDITERKEAEDALGYQHEMRESILDNIPVMVAFFDREGHYQWINRCWHSTLGWSLEEMMQHKDVFAEFYPDPVYRKYVMDYITSAAGAGLWSDFKTRIRDGHVLDTSWINIPLSDGSIIGLGIDITERKRAEEALQRVNQKLNVLSQLTRKDLTNQTFVLSSYLELAKNQLTGQEHIIETLEKGVRSVRLIHDTIEYSKDYQDMGAKPPKWQNVKMALLLGLSHISIGEILHSIETEDLEIFADPLLEKVCQRLFENSVKHGDHVTRIRVWHTVTPEGATIFFEDDGIGIPQEKKEQIFLRSAGTRASRGSLIFVKEILDITGITIRETSEPGKGARFEMVVPKGMWRMAGGNDE